MLESVIAMIVILVLFLALFNLSDQVRSKLLVENAAAKCARARAVRRATADEQGATECPCDLADTATDVAVADDAPRFSC